MSLSPSILNSVICAVTRQTRRLKSLERVFGSMFVGGCTLEAAETLCGADLETLQSLVDKSLIRFVDNRFWMLETIREFALERLEKTGGTKDLRQRHGTYFLALGELAKP